MKRFSLSSLFLLIACCAMGLGWWINRPKPIETFYLHVYANYYRPNQDSWHPLNDRSGTNNYAITRIGTLGIHSDSEIYYNSPIDRNPELEIRGVVKKKGNEFECNISIWLDDPNSTINYEHLTPVSLDELTPFYGNYFFAISREQNPYDLDYFDTGNEQKSKKR